MELGTLIDPSASSSDLQVINSRSLSNTLNLTLDGGGGGGGECLGLVFGLTEDSGQVLDTNCTCSAVVFDPHIRLVPLILLKS